MIDIQYIRDNPDKIKEVVRNKNLDTKLVDTILDLDVKKRALIKDIEDLRAKRNVAARERSIEKGREIKEKLQELEPNLAKTDQEYYKILWKIPNLVSEDTPIGKDEDENVVVKKWGVPIKFTFKPKDHLELGNELDILDTETAAKVTGARFNYLKGDAVLLQNALYQFVIGVLTNEKILRKIADKIDIGYSAKSFIPIIPPLFINPEVYEKMARLSDETEIERYLISRDNQYLIGSAEHTLGPMHIDQTLNENNLPLRYFAFTPAFRREAGSYGKDTKGILRQHQFDKVEMESFTKPEDGIKEQNFFVAIQEHLMQSLEIPYQVVAICTGDMGGPDYRQIDIESWMPGQNKYRETHTSDYMTDYQSRRLQTRIRMNKGDTIFVHMNDATAFAMGRTIIAILENYQEEDGSIKIPEVLRQYMNNRDIIGKSDK